MQLLRYPSKCNNFLMEMSIIKSTIWWNALASVYILGLTGGSEKKMKVVIVTTWAAEHSIIFLIGINQSNLNDHHHCLKLKSLLCISRMFYVNLREMYTLEPSVSSSACCAKKALGDCLRRRKSMGNNGRCCWCLYSRDSAEKQAPTCAFCLEAVTALFSSRCYNVNAWKHQWRCALETIMRETSYL